MKNINIIAQQIVSRTLTDLPAIKTDFSTIKRKIEKLEKDVTTFNGDDTSWEAIENWKPLAEEIIRDLEDVMEKL
jgi:hypothetical protein